MSFNHPLIQKALLTATKYHSGQYRKGNDKIPYITHPTMVAFIVQNYTDNPAVICAALLHDCIEDTKYTFEQLEHDFGTEITEIVRGVTEVEFAQRKKTTWHERKETYKQRLLNAPIESALVSCADRIHNLQDMITMHEKYGEKLWKIFGSVTKEERLAHYENVSNILNKKLAGNPILDEQNRLLELCKNL